MVTSHERYYLAIWNEKEQRIFGWKYLDWSEREDLAKGYTPLGMLL